MQIVYQRSNIKKQSQRFALHPSTLRAFSYQLKQKKPGRNHTVYQTKKRNVFGGTASIPVGPSLY